MQDSKFHQRIHFCYWFTFFQAHCTYAIAVFFFLRWRLKQRVSPLPFVSLGQHIRRLLSRTRIITQWRMPPPAKKSLRTLIHYGSRESPCGRRCRRSRSNTFVLVAAVWPRYLSFHYSHAWSSTWTRIDSHWIGGKWFLMASILSQIGMFKEKWLELCQTCSFFRRLKNILLKILPRKFMWKTILCVNFNILYFYI